MCRPRRLPWASFLLHGSYPEKSPSWCTANKKTIPKRNDKSEFVSIFFIQSYFTYTWWKRRIISAFMSSWPDHFPMKKSKRGGTFWGYTELWILLFSDLQTHYSPFSFLSLEMNFFGGITPTFFFCVAMLWKRSARHVSKFSFFFCWALYANTFSRNGRQKYNAWSTELQ